MLVLAVPAAGPRQAPSVVRKEPNQFSDLHELVSIFSVPCNVADQPRALARRLHPVVRPHVYEQTHEMPLLSNR